MPPGMCSPIALARSSIQRPAVASAPVTPVFTAEGSALATWPFAVPSPVMAATYPAICCAMARAFSARGSMVGLACRYSSIPHAVAPAASGVFQDRIAFQSASPAGPSFAK